MGNIISSLSIPKNDLLCNFEVNGYFCSKTRNHDTLDEDEYNTKSANTFIDNKFDYTQSGHLTTPGRNNFDSPYEEFNIFDEDQFCSSEIKNLQYCGGEDVESLEEGVINKVLLLKCHNSLIDKKNQEIIELVISSEEIKESFSIIPEEKISVHNKCEEFGEYSGEIKKVYNYDLNEYIELKHGHGRIKFADKKTEYVGMWIDNLPNGKGLLKFSDFHYYDGEFKKGFYQGYGKYQNGDDYYCGNWKKSLKHGYGIEKINGNEYRGNFRKGMRYGDGEMICNNGIFKGKLSHDDLYIGKFTSQNAEVFYEGKWNLNQPDGEGSLEFNGRHSTNSAKLAGKFKNGYFYRGSLTLDGYRSVNGKISMKEECSFIIKSI